MSDKKIDEYVEKKLNGYDDKKFPNYFVIEADVCSYLYKKNEGDKRDNLVYTFGYGEKCSVTALLVKCLNYKNAASINFMKERVHRNFWKDEEVLNAFKELYDFQTEKANRIYTQQHKSETEMRAYNCIRKASYMKYKEFFDEVNKKTSTQK